MGTFGGPKPIVTEGLVFAVDAGNNDSYPNGGTTWYDLSGNGNHGTLVNTPSFDSSNGGSIVFDGTDDYIDFGNNISLNPSGEISIGAIFQFPSATIRETVVQKGGYNVDSGMYGLQIVNQKARFALWNDGGDNNYFDTVTTINNNINYVICTWDGNVMKIYINGTLDSSQTYTSTSTFKSNTRNLGIGKSLQENNYYLGGNVFTAYIYNRALTSEEITQNFNSLRGRFGL